MKQKSMKNIRKEFKDNGIFYTPPELARRLASYVGQAERKAPYSVYDPTCGAGNLLSAFPDEVQKYGQELDAEQLALITLPNFHGYAGDTLMDDGFRDMKFDVIVANPPFSVRWDPEALKDDLRFSCAPCLPPPSKADWAFMLHCLYHLREHGVAAILEFPGILYRGQREYKIRRWFIENDHIDRVVNIPGNTFEDTSIGTCIIVLRKDRQGADIVFEDGERSRTVTHQEIADNDFTLSVSTYLPDEVRKEEVDIDSINRQVVMDTISHVRDTFGALTGLQETFPDENFYLLKLREGLREVLEAYPENRTSEEEKRT